LLRVVILCICCWTLLWSELGIALEFGIQGFLSTNGSIHDANKVQARQSVLDADGGLKIIEAKVDPWYDDFITNTPDFYHGNIVALQFMADISDDVSAVMQLVGLPTYDYKPTFSWGFFNWNISDSLTLKFGRLRNPAFLISEYLQVAYAYPWVHPPKEVYEQLPDGLDNFTGVDINMSCIVAGRDLVFNFFGGSANPFTDIAGEKIQLIGRNAIGASVKYGTDEFYLRASYSFGSFGFRQLPAPVRVLQAIATQAADLQDAGALAAFDNTAGPGQLSGTATLTGPGVNHDFRAIADSWEWSNRRGAYWGLGYNLDWNNFYSIAEFARRDVSGWLTSSYGCYFTFGYRYKNFLPNVTFARYRATEEHKQVHPDFSTFVRNGAMATHDFSTIASIVGPAITTSLQESLASSQGDRARDVYRYLRDVLYDNYNNPQDSYTFSIRWDITPGIAVKSTLENVRLKKNMFGRARGFFDRDPTTNGRNHVNIYTISLNAVF